MIINPAFQALVQNDLRLRRTKRHPRSYARIYSLAASVLVFSTLTWGIYKGTITMNTGTLFWVMPVLLLIQLIVSFGLVRTEWRGGTVGWWLSLPYSRRFLVGCKGISSVLLFLQSFLLFFTVILAFIIEALLLRPDLTPISTLWEYLRMSGFGALWYVVLSPMAAFGGVLLGVVSTSRWKPALPLFIAAFWLLGNSFVPGVLLGGLNLMGYRPVSPSFNLLNNHGFLLLITLILSSVITYTLFRLSAYILERKVEL